MGHIFISYVRDDENEVLTLHRRLQEAGFKPWIDQEDILPGKDWELEIRNAIKAADIFLACLSRNSVQKRGVIQKEFAWALDTLKECPENQVYFIPVRLNDCEVPQRMASLQWVDLYKPEGYRKLMRALSLYLKLGPVVSINVAAQLDSDKALRSEHRSLEYVERGRNEVREWGKKMVLGQWDWYSLGNAIEDYLSAIKYEPENQHAWTNIAYVYYLIGAIDIAKICLKTSYGLAEPGPNHPGRNYKNVETAILQNSTLSGGTLVRPPMPDWFKQKYKDFLTLGFGIKTNFRNIEYYLGNI